MGSRYVAHESLTKDFPSLRKRYEDAAKVTLGVTPQPNFFLRNLGWKDIETRTKQIVFLETLFNSLQDKFQSVPGDDELKSGIKYKNEEEKANDVTAKRILLAGCQFILKQLELERNTRVKVKNYDLEKVLHDLLKFSCDKPNDNLIDEKTHAACVLTAHSESFGSLAPKTLSLEEQVQWNEFKEYLKNECSSLTPEAGYQFPIKDLCVSAFSTAGQVAGGLTGYIIGGAAGESSMLVTTRQALTTAVSTGVLCVFPSATLAVTMVVPMGAGKFLDKFCGIQLGTVFGVAMGLVGAGVGWTVGMSLEALKFSICQGIALIARAIYGEEALPTISGITLLDSRQVVCGIEYMEIDELDPEMMNSDAWQVLDIVPKITESSVVYVLNDNSILDPKALAMSPDMQPIVDMLTFDTSGKQPKIEDPAEASPEHEQESYPLFG